MRIVVIGGTGHIGNHLIPMLAEAGMEVVVIARGRTKWTLANRSNLPRIVQGTYQVGDADWPRVLRETVDDADAVIDLLGVDLMGTYQAIRGCCGHVIACGSVWMLGAPRRVPCPAESQIEFWGEAYRRRWEVIQQLLTLSGHDGPRFTAILPPNICGPGKIPLEPRGGRNIVVHRELARGSPVKLPEGPDALIGPCDAEDIAKAFFLTVTHPRQATGRIFNVGSAYALTASEFVAAYAEIYRVQIPIERVSWPEFYKVIPDPGARYHFEAHMCPDISAIREALGFQPRFTPVETMARAVEWMRGQKLL